MSAAEIVYRVRKVTTANLQQSGLFTASVVPEPNFSSTSLTWMNKYPTVDPDGYIEAATDIEQGLMDVFALGDVRLGAIPDWNRDPKTNVNAPDTFGKKLDYRDNNKVGDIKYLWEINRHLQLVCLAEAFSLTGEEKYLLVIRRQIDSWISNCRYLYGPNWTSSLELGIRLINWSLVWQFIGGRESPIFKDSNTDKFLQRWLKSIYQHTHFIRGNFSRFSSANNHLIGEAAGFFIATITWPFWNEFSEWQRQAKGILEEEVLLQNAADGVNREQAISYQQFVLDFLIIAGLAGHVNNSEFSEDYWKRIETMLEYLASIMNVAGNVPMIGDADDGYVVKLSQEQNFCPYRSLLATGAIIFNRSDFKKKAGRLDDKTRWLLGNDADEKFNAISTENVILPVHRQFPEGGYYILGSDFETEEETRVIVDAGPLGYRSIAAHGHADALAFTLSIYGREFLIDPGTYAYHTQQKWRDYFRGTSAHNTIRIDYENQSVISGNFMWSKKAQASCYAWKPDEQVDYFAGSHDGYSRLDDPVIHRRELRLDKVGRKLLVTDKLKCVQTHGVEQFWHFSEGCHITFQGSEVKAENSGVTLFLTIRDTDVDIDVRKGQEVPPLGWVSRRFDVKVPTTTIVVRCQANGTRSLTASLKWIRA